MSFFTKLFSGGLTGVVDSLGGIIDELSTSQEEKQQLKVKLQSQLMQMEKEAEASYRSELESRAEIIKAELAQGDAYTKRARPTIIYAGLLFIFIAYVLTPVLAHLSGQPNAKELFIELPDQFWWAWGTVVGVYGAGRTAEKLGAANRLTQAATGSGAYRVAQRKNEALG